MTWSQNNPSFLKLSSELAVHLGCLLSIITFSRLTYTALLFPSLKLIVRFRLFPVLINVTTYPTIERPARVVLIAHACLCLNHRISTLPFHKHWAHT